MSEIEIPENEKTIDSWTLNYLPADSGRYVGVLTITDLGVYFESNYSVQFTGDAVKEVVGGLSFAKSDITSFEAIKSYWIFQRVEITLTDKSIHTFDRGIMSTAKIMAALKAGEANESTAD